MDIFKYTFSLNIYNSGLYFGMLVKLSSLTDKESPLTNLTKRQTSCKGCFLNRKKTACFLLSYDVQALKREQELLKKIIRKMWCKEKLSLRIRQIANLVQKAAYSRPLTNIFCA